MGGLRRWRLAWWWVPLWCTCCCFVLLTAAPLSYATAPSELIARLQTRLQTISAAAVSLQAESAAWKRLSTENEQRLSGLLSELAELRRELESWQIASENSRKLVAELKASLERSEAKLTRVSQTLRASADSWKAAADAADLRVRKTRRGGVVVAILAALAGGVTGYFIGK